MVAYIELNEAFYFSNGKVTLKFYNSNSIFAKNNKKL